MTDNEIIKALKDEIRRANYIESYYIDCVDIGIFQNAINLITLQQAEIENLKVENKSLRTAANSLKMHYEEAQAEIENYKHLDVILHTAIDKLTANIKSEAVKEFAEEFEYFVLHEDIEVVEPKCKDYESYINGANQFRHQIKNGINNLVKEMTEVETNQRKEDEGK